MVVDSGRLEETGVVVVVRVGGGAGFYGGEALGSRKEKLLKQETGKWMAFTTGCEGAGISV